MTTEVTNHRGAGILFVTPEGKALFLKRGNGGDAPGAWCFPGGTTEDGETAEQTAIREAEEELGSRPKGSIAYHTRTITPVQILEDGMRGPVGYRDVDFTTFVQKVDKEFAPTLNGEHTGWAWAPIGAPPEPLHPGCQIALARFGMNELDVARVMASGQLTSPQKYSNMWLFDMRITGTGTAYRSAKFDDKGKEISPEEFVYRRPENYLTDDFLQRCNGLQVIMMHPPKAVLDSKEFGKRTVGSMMLPYIKGDEVWGIAKIYDDDAVVAMQSTHTSTSPTVLVGGRKMKMEDGTNLLVENDPTLLDHLAICARGVWDKGDDPSGIRIDNQGAMTMTKEELEALNKMVAEAVAASVPGAVTNAVIAARADDAGIKKMDSIMTAMDSVCGKMDSFGKRMDEHGKRMDAAEKKKEDDDGETIAADEDEAKKKADAEEKAKEEKEKADSEAEEKAKDDAAHEEKEGLKARIAALESSIPKQLTGAANDAPYADAQARADEAEMGFGRRAARPLIGEEILPYRKRLIGGLKEFSTRWKGVDVSAFADSAFSIVEEDVFRAAAEAAKMPPDLKDDELRPVIKADSAGRQITTYVGRHSFIRSLKRPARYVTEFKFGQSRA